ncbi:MAG: hypothetical protein PHX18_01675 [Candidatus Gastranaerophilales bacterium]|nr:hypothetical protein [Candidatus Gastranaerophilales bacterium]
MHKITSTVLIAVFAILLSAYAFPEKLPEAYDLNRFQLEKIKFQNTTIAQFQQIAPKYPTPEYEGIYAIFKEKDLDTTYKSVRIGFKDNYLDWIEFDFAVPQTYSKFIKTYGKPLSVNTEYSKKYNYHDYNFYNIVTDKNNVSVFSITLYGTSDYNSSIGAVINKLPDYKSFNFINEFIPGKYLENDFKASYSKFQPTNASVKTDKTEYKIPPEYMVAHPLYKSASLVFHNGILNFINLEPKNLSITELKTIYGNGKLVRSSNPNIVFFEYPNFVATLNQKSTMITNIGIIGAN